MSWEPTKRTPLPEPNTYQTIIQLAKEGNQTPTQKEAQAILDKLFTFEEENKEWTASIQKAESLEIQSKEILGIGVARLEQIRGDRFLGKFITQIIRWIKQNQEWKVKADKQIKEAEKDKRELSQQFDDIKEKKQKLETDVKRQTALFDQKGLELLGLQEELKEAQERAKIWEQLVDDWIDAAEEGAKLFGKSPPNSADKLLPLFREIGQSTQGLIAAAQKENQGLHQRINNLKARAEAAEDELLQYQEGVSLAFGIQNEDGSVSSLEIAAAVGQIKALKNNADLRSIRQHLPARLQYGTPTPQLLGERFRDYVQGIQKQLQDCLAHKQAADMPPRPTRQMMESMWDMFPTSLRRSSNIPVQGSPNADADLWEMLQNMMAGRTADGRDPPGNNPQCGHARELAITIGQTTNQDWNISALWVSNLKDQVAPRPGPMIPEEPSQPCNHTEAIASILNRPATQLWDDSLMEIRGLMAQLNAGGNPQNQQAPVMTGLTQVVSAPKPPSFGDNTSFENYRALARLYIRSIAPRSPEQILMAISGMMQAWTGKRLEFIRQIDPERFMKPSALGATWVETTEEFLEFTRKQFQPILAFSESQEEWVRTPSAMQRAAHETVESFFMDFQSRVLRVQDNARTNSDRPGQEEITRIFIASLPRAIKDAIRPLAPLLETAEFHTYRNLIAQHWHLLKRGERKAGVKLASSLGKRDREEEESGSEDEGNVMFIKRNKTGCLVNKKWEEKPAVPLELCGPINHIRGMTTAESQAAKKRLHLCRKERVCRRCRRNKSQHEGLSSPMDELPEWDGPKINVIQETQELLNTDVPEEEQ